MSSIDQSTVSAMQMADRIADLVLHPKHAAEALRLTRQLECVLAEQVRAVGNVTYITK